MSEAGERKEVCRACQWWEAAGTAVGQCHRYPVLTNTSPAHWCAEHKPAGNALGYERPEQLQPRRPGRPRKIV